MLQAVFTNKSLKARRAAIESYPVDANLNLAEGSPVALVSGTAVASVLSLTISGGTPTSGSVDLLMYGKKLTVAFNETASSLTGKLNALFGTGSFTVSGGALPGTALTLTPARNYAGLTPAVPLVTASSLSAGTLTPSLSTPGVPKGKIVGWNPAKLAAPTAALVTYSGTGSAGTWLAGTYSLQHTWETATGETLPSPAVNLTLTANQSLRIAAITAGNTPDQAVALNIYANGARIARIAVTTPGSAGNVVQTDIANVNGATGADGKRMPSENLAFTNSDGRQVFLGFLKQQTVTDEVGKAFHAAPQFVGDIGKSTVEVFVGGEFKMADLSFASGTIDEFVRQMNPRVLAGRIAVGDALIAFGPYGDDAR
jgi:hypothetical protein